MARPLSVTDLRLDQGWAIVRTGRPGSGRLRYRKALLTGAITSHGRVKAYRGVFLHHRGAPGPETRIDPSAIVRTGSSARSIELGR